MQARKPDPSMVRAILKGAPRYAHPQVSGFYTAGQWVEAWGGITTAARSGRKAVQALCRDDGIHFSTSIPGE
jgi:hypothetical protein